jgi:hypothetical protein
MNSTNLVHLVTFVFWAVLGFILGRNAGEQVGMRRVDEEYARFEHREMPTRFPWADWQWLQVTILSLGGSFVVLGWHGNVLRSLGIFLLIFVICYWWERSRPPARVARLRMQIEQDARVSSRILHVQRYIMLVLGVLMFVLPAPYSYWVMGIGVVFALIGSLIDTFVIGPAQLRRIQRMNRDIDDLLK